MQTDEKKTAEALVFSDEAGEPIGRFRTAWVTAVLKAHGVKPEWTSYNWTALTPACQQEFRRINLHWHHLRHEYASRLVERGVPLAAARPGSRSARTRVDHDNGALRQSKTGEPAGSSAQARQRQKFDPSDANRVENSFDDRDKASSFVQDQAKVTTIDWQKTDRETAPNSEDENDFEVWLGGRDSKPRYRGPESRLTGSRPLRSVRFSYGLVRDPVRVLPSVSLPSPGSASYNVSPFGLVFASPRFGIAAGDHRGWGATAPPDHACRRAA